MSALSTNRLQTGKSFILTSMEETVGKLLPVLGGFVAAFAIKKLGWLKPAHGELLLKVGFYVTIPCLIFASVSRLGFTHSLLLFPALSALILAVTFPLTLLVARRLKLPRRTEGTFKIAPLTLNSAFILPFLTATFGGEGATRVVLFNAGYNPLLLIGVYGLAATYNPDNTKRRDIVKRILILPPLWALLLGLFVNLNDITIPGFLNSTLGAIGNITIFLVIAALGLLFNPKRLHLDTTLILLGLRMGIGLVIGVLICVVLQLEGVDRAALLALAVAPFGFNLLTFSATEKLDRELAASAISLSLLVGLVLVPLLIVLTG